MNILDKMSIKLIFPSILLFICSANAWEEEETIAEIELGGGENKQFIVDSKKEIMIGVRIDLTADEAYEKCPHTDPEIMIVNGEEQTFYKSYCIKVTQTNLPKNDMRVIMKAHEKYYSSGDSSAGVWPQKGRIEFNVENLADFSIHLTVYHHEVPVF